MSRTSFALATAALLLAGCNRARPNAGSPPTLVTVPAGGPAGGTVTVALEICTICHGDLSRSRVIFINGADPLVPVAPPLGTGGETVASAPAVGAHLAHLVAGELANAMLCSSCHQIPAIVQEHSAQKIFFSGLAVQQGAQPNYNTDGTCSNAYCHGNFANGNASNKPAWTGSGQAACGTCHGLPPGGSHPSVAPGSCGTCHPGYTGASVNVATHINGMVDVVAGEPANGGVDCGGCHSAIFNAMNGGAARLSRHALGAVAGKNDDFNDSGIAWTGALGANAPSSRSCVNMCHDDHPHTLTSPSTTTHENNVYADASTQTARAATTRTSADKASTDFDDTKANGGLCISCHKNEVDASRPALSQAAFAASAHDYTSNAVSGTTFAWTYTLHDNSQFRRNCTKCHAGGDAGPNSSATAVNAVHGSQYPSLLSGTTNPAGAPATFACYKCHGGGGVGADYSGKNIYAATLEGFAHPVNGDTVHATVAEQGSAPNDGSFSGANRHVNCLDCHNPHAATPVGLGGSVTAFTAQTGTTPAAVTDSTKTWTANQWKGYTFKVTAGTAAGNAGVIWGNTTNTLSVGFAAATAPTLDTTSAYAIIPAGTSNGGALPATMTGAFGLAPAFPDPPSPPDWNDTTAPANAADLTTQYTAITTWGQTTAPTRQGQVCLKCHSAYAYGSTPPNTPSGLGTSTSSAWVNTAGGTMPQSDLANQFNPNNLSHHAVFARGKNQPLVSSATATSTYNPNWPKFNTATVNTGDCATPPCSVTFSAPLPLTVLPGWFLYVGSIAPGQGSTGWYEVLSVSSDTTLTVDRATTAGTAQQSFLTAGLGNDFVPPWGPWSTLQCTDCHASDAVTDPFGPHGSGTKWLLRKYTNPNFLFFSGTGVVAIDPNTGGTPDANNLCLNCHRRDVYGDYAFTSAANNNYSRQNHPMDTSSGQAFGTKPRWGIVCMNCHGGARSGTIHGTNLGLGGGGSAASYSGKRLLAGATWVGVTRSTTTSAGSCFMKGTADNVTNCSHTIEGAFGSGTANYDYDTNP